MRNIFRLTIIAALMLPIAPGTSFGQNLKSPKDIFRANIEATGGMDAWNNVKTMHMSGEISMEMDVATMVMTNETWIIRPGYLLTKVSIVDAPQGMPTGDNVVYITPDGGWIDGMQGHQDISSLPAAQREQVESQMNLKEELTYLNQPDSLFSLLDSRDLDGAPVYVVAVQGDIPSRRLYDQQSLLLKGTEFDSPMAGTITLRSSDYRDSSGLLVSYQTQTDMGMAVSTMKVKNIEFNTDVTPEKLADMAGN